MKKILMIGLLACTTLLTGCFDIVEEIFLNKDGSGKYQIVMDMSNVFNDPMMKGMLENAMKDENNNQPVDLEKDSIIYFKDLREGTEKLSAEESKLLENLLMRMTMSESKKQMLIRLEYDFKKVEEVTKMSQVMQKLGADQQIGGGMPGGSLLSGEAASFTWKRGLLKRLSVKLEAESDKDEDMEMMKMFLSEASYKTIYHLPGKVKTVDIPNAIIKENTVTVTNNILDFIDGKVKIDGEIRFK